MDKGWWVDIEEVEVMISNKPGIRKVKTKITLTVGGYNGCF